MISVLSGVPGFLPGPDDFRELARKVDTARHQGVPAGCILEIDLQQTPAETAGFDPVAVVSGILGASRPLLLRETVAAIHRAAEDPRVAGLIARVQLDAAPPGPVQELRAAIAAFTERKPSLAWAETYPGTLSYYLASAFGEVWMQPSGTVGLVGFATSALFLRDALDKLGVEAQFTARGEYKSAANLFTQDGYTEAHREADTALVNSLRAQVWEAVAAARKIDPAVIDGLADRAPLLREDAVTAGLVDRIGFRDEAYARIADMTGAAGDTDADGDDAPPRLFLSRYARTSRPSVPTPTLPGRKGRQTIAVVTLAGPIVSGRGRPVSPFGGASAGGDTIAAALRQAGADDDVAAVVLRVDSPGGSVTGSETIWREVVRLRERGTPVVASMGAVAASGGYYVSMAADAIVANAATITGSIGVVTGKLVARDLKDRLGVGSGTVRTNANADAWSVNAPFTDEQQAQVEAEADLFYTDFVHRVADGRKMSAEAVDQVARGRVWTGADALERGLVDELGGLRTAITRAKALAGIDEGTKVRIVALPGSSLRDMVLAGIDEGTKVRIVALPGSSLRDMVRPKASSQPAAASVSEMVSALAVRSLTEVVDQTQRSLTGVNVLWLGASRY